MSFHFEHEDADLQQNVPAECTPKAGLRVCAVSLGNIGANCYLLTDEASGDCAVIDPGFSGKRLDRLAESAPPQNIKLIILTHRHFDHILGVASLKQQTGAQVAIHHLDAPALTDPQLSLSRLVGKQQPVDPDILLCDGDVLPLGSLTLQILHTPGHTEGGICILCGDALFTGDTLFLGDIGRTDLPTGDYSALLDSIAKLGRLPGNLTVYPGHGPQTTLEHERKFNQYMKL